MRVQLTYYKDDFFCQTVAQPSIGARNDLLVTLKLCLAYKKRFSVQLKQQQQPFWINISQPLDLKEVFLEWLSQQLCKIGFTNSHLNTEVENHWDRTGGTLGNDW